MSSHGRSSANTNRARSVGKSPSDYIFGRAYFLPGSFRDQLPVRRAKCPCGCGRLSGIHILSASLSSGSQIRQGGSQTAARWLSKSVQVALTRRHTHPDADIALNSVKNLFSACHFSPLAYSSVFGKQYLYAIQYSKTIIRRIS